MSSPSSRTFGVAQRLGAEAAVFHDSLFELGNLGRLSDLIVACARTTLIKKGIQPSSVFDERSVRALLATSVSGIFQSLEKWSVFPPILIECGLNSKKLILGMSWSGSTVESGVENSLRQDVQFLEWLKHAASYASGLRIRVSSTHPMTLECLFELPALGEKFTPLDPERIPWETVELQEKSESSGEYFQLGDVNYPALLKESTARIGAPSQAAEKQIISGVTDHQYDETIRVSGKSEKADPELFQIPGQQADEEKEEDQPPEPSGWMSSLIKKIWPFKESKPESGITSTVKSSVSTESPEAWIVELQREQEQALDKTLASIQKSAEGDKSKRWVDGLMGEIIAEKSRLQELGRKLSLSLKQKEFEFQTKEKALHEELRKKEEKLQKSTRELKRAKEKSEISQKINLGPRKKTSDETSEENVAQLKQKYHLTQQLLTAAKLENAEYKSKIDELRGQLTNSMLGAKQQSQNISEVATLKSRVERLARQSDELKKVNQQLNDKLNELKKENVRAGNEPQEMKEKLDSALKTIAQLHKETLRLQTKGEELQREEMRLKLELGRAQEEAKQLRLALKAGKKGPQAA